MILGEARRQRNGEPLIVADGRLGPHGLEQLVLGHHAVGMKRQEAQHGKGLHPKGNDGPASVEQGVVSQIHG